MSARGLNEGGTQMLKKILIGLAVLVLGFAGFVAAQPATYHVERTQLIDAPAEVVFAQLDDLHAWEQWSPWAKLDPTMQKTYEGTDRQVGASYAWQGNDEVGKGQMTITERELDRHLGLRLEFMEPFASVASTQFHLSPAEGDATHVTWAMDGNNNFIGKLFGLFVDMDTMIGADFDKGLASLQSVSEAAHEALEHKRQAEAAARAEAPRPADAEGAAADGPTAGAAEPAGAAVPAEAEAAAAAAP